MNFNHCLICSSVAGTEYTVGTYVDFYNQQQSNLRVQLWATTLRNTAILQLETANFTSGINAPLSYISYYHAKEASLWKPVLLLHNERSWIWTVCRSAKIFWLYMHMFLQADDIWLSFSPLPGYAYPAPACPCSAGHNCCKWPPYCRPVSLVLDCCPAWLTELRCPHWLPLGSDVPVKTDFVSLFFLHK